MSPDIDVIQVLWLAESPQGCRGTVESGVIKVSQLWHWRREKGRQKHGWLEARMDGKPVVG
ncbi:hypothetical protein KSX_93360 [Ktedonospora formicarum]|uniref:Uncharacterized protein n=1 Tax=Ktedonospora formicarum TaxID=2778364 RepID=A0A8J3IBZ5_9CHLR|nr:hypothetical protein KSX_93360 [Ktedonospora formicarum]